MQEGAAGLEQGEDRPVRRLRRRCLKILDEAGILKGLPAGEPVFSGKGELSAERLAASRSYREACRLRKECLDFQERLLAEAPEELARYWNAIYNPGQEAGETMTVKEQKGLNELKQRITAYYPELEDWDLVEKAYNFALEVHSNQRRQSGESFISHPLGVARILADLELDLITISAGLLHDVVEDTDVTLETIEKEFGAEVALLVDGVTKLSRMEFTSREEQQAETLRKMFIAMAKDIRVVLIKLADRTHNLRTLRYLNTFKQKEIARETLEIYAPWPTAWASTSLSGNWRTWLSATCSRGSITGWWRGWPKKAGAGELYQPGS